LDFNKLYSKNYKVDHLFKSGIQLVSLNMQRPDKFWFINRAIFHKDYENNNDTPYSAYILKPKWLLGLEPFPNYYNVEISCDSEIKIEYVGNNLPQIIKKTEKNVFENIDITLPIFYIEYKKDYITYRNAIKLDINKNEYKLKLFNIEDKIMQYQINSDVKNVSSNDCINQKYPLYNESIDITFITLNVTFYETYKPLSDDIKNYNEFWKIYKQEWDNYIINNNINNNRIFFQQNLVKFMKNNLDIK
jgi:hypothetical protein